MSITSLSSEPDCDCVTAARSYAERGWSPIPLPASSKIPDLKDWPKLRIEPENVSQFFKPGMNIGVLLGEPSGWLVDVDLDCADALFLASEFLPNTGSIFGRASKPSSHWLYTVSSPVETMRLKNIYGEVMVELRAGGCQTVFPPSVHSAQAITWVRHENPSSIDSLELRRHVVLLAIACQVAPFWPPKGCRHEVALSLAGGLLRDNVDINSAQRIIHGICIASGDDETRDRLKAIFTTARRNDAHLPTTGWNTLRNYFSQSVIDKLRGFVGLITTFDASLPNGSNSGQRQPPGGEDRRNTTERLLEIANCADLYHTPDKDSFASFPVGSHRENWPLTSREFKGWLMRLFYQEHGKPPARESMHDALEMLQARALFDGSERRVFTRLGYSETSIFLDLCNSEWEAVIVTPAGWRISKEYPIQFRRPRGMLDHPIPTSGGNVEQLFEFVTVPDERNRALLLSWLLAAFYPEGPFPILVLQGEAGTAKSTTSFFIRSLIDPSIASLRSMPRDDRDLMISAQNGWVMSFDNLSKMPFWFSDALCRLATGGGFATRELYSNDSEKIFDSMRPVILNGIDDLAVRDDLVDRALIVNLARIPDDRRRTRRELIRTFEAARPAILGSLLDVLSKGLANLNSVRLSSLPRMADFVQLITAAEPALGWEGGTFNRIYAQDRVDSAAGWVESDTVAFHVLGLLESTDQWSGTSSELLAALNSRVTPGDRPSKTWPQTPQALSGRVRRAAPALRSSGIDVDFTRESHSRRRLINLRNRRVSDCPQ